MTLSSCKGLAFALIAFLLAPVASQTGLQGQPAPSSQSEINSLGQRCAHSPNEKNSACTDLARISANSKVDINIRIAAAKSLASQGSRSKGGLNSVLEEIATTSGELPLREAALRGISMDDLVKIALSTRDQTLGAGIVNAIGDKGAGDCSFPNCFGLDEQRHAMRSLSQIIANAEIPEVRDAATQKQQSVAIRFLEKQLPPTGTGPGIRTRIDSVSVDKTGYEFVFTPLRLAGNGTVRNPAASGSRYEIDTIEGTWKQGATETVRVKFADIARICKFGDTASLVGNDGVAHRTYGVNEGFFVALHIVSPNTTLGGCPSPFNGQIHLDR